MQALSISVPEYFSTAMISLMKWHERLPKELDARGWSVPRLAAEMGKPGDKALIDRIYKWMKGKVDNPRGTAVVDMAEALGMTELEFRGVAALTNQNKKLGDASTHLPNAAISGSISGFVRIPIQGQGMGGKDGALLFSVEQNMGDVLAPPMLAGIPGAYAVYVIGDSMLDRYRAGEVVYVHPYMPVRKDDDCVVQIEKDGNRLGWIKRFVSWDEKLLKVRQLRPKKILRFPTASVVSCHRIVGSGMA